MKVTLQIYEKLHRKLKVETAREGRPIKLSRLMSCVFQSCVSTPTG
jgi:hypothetical protein